MAYSPTTWTEGITDLGPTNMNHLEQGVQAAATVADAAIPAPIGPATSAGLVFNGSSWVAATLVNANINAAAAIAYSKLNLAGGIVNNDVSGSAAIAYSKLNLASSIVSADIVDGTIVNADISASAAISTSKIAGFPTYYRKTTAKTVNTSSAETDLLNGEITVAANAIGASGRLRLHARGDWKQNSGAALPPPQFKLKLGATTLLDTSVFGTNVAGNSATRFEWQVNADIFNLGATNSQWATIDLKINYADNGTFAAQAFATGEGMYSTIAASGTISRESLAHGGNSSAVDTTASNVLALSVINASASANYETVLKNALVVIE